MVTFRDLTYYALGGPVARVLAPSSLSSLHAVWRSLCAGDEPVALIGAGSNVLCSDEPFDGTVLSCRNLCGWQVLSQASSSLQSKVGTERAAGCTLLLEAGLSNTECAELALELGYKDLAWMYRMPGQLGATIRMNARCYGGEISRFVSDVYTLDHEGLGRHYSGADVFRGYKDTVFMTSREVVLCAIVRLSLPADDASILAEMERCEADRHRKGHFLYPSCGSTFKNNYAIGKPSGQIFDELGFKGQTRGQAQVSELHGNFIFNTGQAQANDVMGLAADMAEAARRAGMDLMLEVQPVGQFPKDLAKSLRLAELDSGTIESGTSVVTGLVRLGRLQDSASGGEHFLPRGSHRGVRHLCTIPFAGWNHAHADSLGRVHFEAHQLVALEQADPEAPLLRLQFVCQDLEQWRRLTRMRPQHSGFQDGLWNFSVFECFLFFGGTTERYLELEIQDAFNWLALDFEGTRQRRQAGLAPMHGIVPFGPVAVGEGGAVAVGFELTRSALSPYLESSELCVKAAYAGFEERHATERCYATAPKRSHEAQCSLAKPDFHTVDDTLTFVLL